MDDNKLVSPPSLILDNIPSPCYVCEEARLLNNLALLEHVQQQSGAKILLALKGFAMWSTFGHIAKVLHGTAASGLWEAQLGREKMGGEVHTFSPAFKAEEIAEIAAISDHIVFNSFNQWQQFKQQCQNVSCGIRVNPEYSEVSPEIYNPCAPYSRLGVTRDQFRPDLLEGLDGLHFHTHCEQNSDALERTLAVVEEKFGEFFPRLRWINFGGGHHITREDYDVEKLIGLIKDFRRRYDLEVYLEPGEAIGWQTGPLVASVVDIVRNRKNIAVLDVSATNHMPDCLEMPYRPEVRGAALPGKLFHDYLLTGPSCLAGDIIGEYSFDHELKVGEKLAFKDMVHYTFVKNTAFNGIKLPSLGIWTQGGEFKLVRQFHYEDYRDRLS